MSIRATLDAKPLVEFCRHKEMTDAELLLIGFDPGYVRRIEAGKATAVSVDLADKVLRNAGSILELVYPSPLLDALPEIRATCPECALLGYFIHHPGGMWVCSNCGSEQRRRPFMRSDSYTIPQQAVTEYFQDPHSSIQKIADKYSCSFGGLLQRIQREELPRRPQGGGRVNPRFNLAAARAGGWESLAKQAHDLRKSDGLPWKVIAERLGYSSNITAMKAAKKYADGDYRSRKTARKDRV